MIDLHTTVILHKRDRHLLTISLRILGAKCSIEGSVLATDIISV